MKNTSDENFLSRWARLKNTGTQPEDTDADAQPADQTEAAAPADETSPPDAKGQGTSASGIATPAGPADKTKQTSSDQRGAAHSQASDQVSADAPSASETATPPPLTDADMPPLDSLDENSDFTGFMSSGVSAELRKLALRKMFKASVFNERDGLDDYDDDYTSFVPRGNLVTSDMKHMAGVEARRALEKTLSNEGNTMTPATARDTAMQTLQDFNSAPTSQVEYYSQGRVLIIGGQQALQIATQLPDSLHPTILLTEAVDIAAGKSIVTLQQGRDITLKGWLGQFSVTLNDPNTDAAPEVLSTDVVLDLSEAPLLTVEVPPPGYFSTAKTELTEALEDISGLEGRFAKPKFFEYNADICAHSRSGLDGCTLCIDACPTEAIISIGERIKVEPQLCQGGGTCATVCPTGAIRYNYPSPAHYVDQLRRLLKSYRDAGGQQPVILFHARDTEVEINSLPETILPIALEELASAGADLWSVALSFGASQILLLDDAITPKVSRQALRHQLSILNTQLAGLRYPDGAVRLIPAASDAQPHDFQELLDNGESMPYFPPATQGGLNNKRQQWMLALDHLYKYAPQPEDEIPLPSGAPFGRLKVDQDSCTLCMACATICPAQALSGGSDSPVLKLHTANCVQCGLCETGCPENAITLEPVYVSNREKRNRPVLLSEEKPFHCITCGKPFASQSMILTMLGKLQGHAMFQTERAKNRLKMCEDCRVIDVVQDEHAMGQPGLVDPSSATKRH